MHRLASLFSDRFSPQEKILQPRPTLDSFPPTTLEQLTQLSEAILSGCTIPEKDVISILHKTRQLLKDQETIIRLLYPISSKKNSKSIDKIPFTIVGDLHGNFESLMSIFLLNGLPSPTNPYLFLGDYVDRGTNGVEVFILLCAYKLLYPNYVHLLMGNHETEPLLHKNFGFYQEIITKYSFVSDEDDEMDFYSATNVYNCFLHVFFSLPLAAVVYPSIDIVNTTLLPSSLVGSSNAPQPPLPAGWSPSKLKPTTPPPNSIRSSAHTQNSPNSQSAPSPTIPSPLPPLSPFFFSSSTAAPSLPSPSSQPPSPSLLFTPNASPICTPVNLVSASLFGYDPLIGRGVFFVHGGLPISGTEGIDDPRLSLADVARVDTFEILRKRHRLAEASWGDGEGEGERGEREREGGERRGGEEMGKGEPNGMQANYVSSVSANGRGGGERGISEMDEKEVEKREGEQGGEESEGQDTYLNPVAQQLVSGGAEPAMIGRDRSSSLRTTRIMHQVLWNDPTSQPPSLEHPMLSPRLLLKQMLSQSPPSPSSPSHSSSSSSSLSHNQLSPSSPPSPSSPASPYSPARRSQRGQGTYLFDQSISNAFLDRCGLRCIVRSHEAKMKGFEVMQEGRCVTVFSSAHYSGWINKGAVAHLRFDRAQKKREGREGREGRDGLQRKGSHGSDMNEMSQSSSSSSSSNMIESSYNSGYGSGSGDETGHTADSSPMSGHVEHLHIIPKFHFLQFDAGLPPPSPSPSPVAFGAYSANAPKPLIRFVKNSSEMAALKRETRKRLSSIVCGAGIGCGHGRHSGQMEEDVCTSDAQRPPNSPLRIAWDQQEAELPTAMDIENKNSGQMDIES
ncbi:putative phosphoprotein phosphatase 1 [Monocercomonoides exilis]|uniref:putative phosphoprotein phosphatase 1 n=1 Tax=Monocercomonoides exilis TaxID=2049356 RepID=UPI00355ABE5E|nr:putative phosphoprotein phosphatase 1 [Monocercomonoides exilis]|eukprot:MONOS_3759.1-p1 / transcript=MONOS_3759.1 / gene=MONOS_3759 / organism=Monocercomonoides_exilis_PA203 / gene_product=putative phosphoprotein phosphatase 1 / transcript_product=putative phosphoprotein phosphatase 1 / location=Mono_scaffold00091:109707-112296(-) / protein_length=846 / sequence_SO=supercontig / SO=protein_coding / is_pseudo=false